MAQEQQGIAVVSEAARMELSLESFGHDGEIFRLLVARIQDYAIFLLDKHGVVRTWNEGAEKIKGYKAQEIIGQHFSRFYPQEARESGWPSQELELASQRGRFADEGWRVKQDGSTFWANVVITAIRDEGGELIGFAKVTHDLTGRRKLEERLLELNRQLNDRVMQLSESRREVELQTVELQRLSSNMARLQDEERRRIARELHDDLGQHLAALKMTLHNCWKGEPNPKQAEALQLVDEALVKVRNMSYLLHPPLLDESGLAAAVHWYVDGFEKRSNLRVALEVSPVGFTRLSRETEVAVFRVVQEALTNVYRHSGSKDARIEIRQEADRVTVKVRDFGKGIPPGIIARPLSAGVGIGGIRERVQHFGGTLIISRARPGTLLEASIPLFPNPEG